MRRLITTFLSTILALLPIHATAQNDVHLGFSISKLSRIDAMATQYIAAGLLPDVMYGVARAEGIVHTASVSGYKPDDVFRIYSMTKPITAVAALILMEEGQLLLTDPVARYLPEFGEMQVLEADGSLRAATRPMTIRHLLTHTAGLSYGGYEHAVSKRYEASDHWSASSLEEFSKRIARLPLAADPGTFWHYSVSLDVLGRVIEVASGETLDQIFKTKIFDPLGMSETGFTLREDQRDRLVPLYEYREGGMTPAAADEINEYLKPNFPAGGGGLVSTLPDYLRFARMLLGNGELEGARILSRKTVDMMMADHLLAMGPGMKVNEAWLGNTENRNGSAELLGFGYGLGGAVIRDPIANGIPGSQGTYGWGGTGNTYFFVDRAENVSGVFFTQLRPSGTYPVRGQFRTLVYQAMD